MLKLKIIFMKKLLLFSIYFTSITIAIAQNSDNSFRKDTIEKNVILDEVTVHAPQAIQRGDKKIYFPNDFLKSTSNNALSLLDKLRLNGIQINTLFNTISVSGGGNAIFCINGRVVELNDILAIKPEEVSKIECNDNPGARYNNASIVINFKLKNNLQGGGFMADLMEAFNTVYGKNRISGKYNNKLSEWSVNYNMLHASFKEYYNMNREDYTFLDGNSVTQTETGYPGKLKFDNHYLTINYNYGNSDKWMFNAALRGKYTNTPTSQLNSLLTSSEFPNVKFNLNDDESSHESSTALDLYYQNSIAKNKTFLIDVIGIYTSTSDKLNYMISRDNVIEKLIKNNVDGNKYTLIVEGMYEVGMNMNKAVFGLKQNLGYASNHYYGSQDEINSLHNAETYGYAEWNYTSEKWSGAFSIGATYLSFSQKGEGYNKFYLNPMLRLSYTPSPFFFVRYRGKIDSKSPSLAELSNIRQYLDNYQIREGNPNLKPSNLIFNQITFDYHKPMWSTSFSLEYDYNRKAIMESTILEKEQIIRTFNNHRSWQKLNAEYELKLMLLRGLINFRGVIGVDRYISKGLDYKYAHNNIYAMINMVAAYKFLALSFNMVTHKSFLYGETLQLGEDLHYIALTYFKKNFSVTLAMNNPFMDNYKTGSENWNKYGKNYSYRYVNETSRMMLLNFNWSFNFGRKYDVVKQKIINEDSDTGILKGKK